MFTGIIEGVGQLEKVEHFKAYSRMVIRSDFSLKGTKLGDSIAVNGCCLTVTTIKGNQFSVDVSPETLARTALGEFKKGDSVNLERALRMGDRLGGHWVQGHVDGLGKITEKKYIKAEPDAYYLVKLKLPKNLITYVIEKGSITIDGISLTVNQLKGQQIELCIIPHTQSKTTLTGKNEGDRVNVEVDVLCKILEKLVEPMIKNLSRKKK